MILFPLQLWADCFQDWIGWIFSYCVNWKLGVFSKIFEESRNFVCQCSSTYSVLAMKLTLLVFFFRSTTINKPKCCIPCWFCWICRNADFAAFHLPRLDKLCVFLESIERYALGDFPCKLCLNLSASEIRGQKFKRMDL